jgi:hypothetical protein
METIKDLYIARLPRRWAVLRELAKIGFSDIRKAVAWRNEMVAREDEEERKGDDGVVRVTRVLLPQLCIVPSEEMDPDIAAAIAQISQGPNGEVRVRLHDKHAALVSNIMKKNRLQLFEAVQAFLDEGSRS